MSIHYLKSANDRRHLSRAEQVTSDEASEVVVKVPPLPDRVRLQLVRESLLALGRHKEEAWRRLKAEAEDAFEQAARVREQMDFGFPHGL